MNKSEAKRLLFDFCNVIGYNNPECIIESYLDYPNPVIKFDDDELNYHLLDDDKDS